ncbi:MAG: hypothetical protein CMK07_04770 [Ponticaulis sp.]|nr:hypothetical protein [Ponticaulis sp.]
MTLLNVTRVLPLVLFVGALPAQAMTAKECQTMQAELASQHKSLTASYEELKRMGEQADEVGDEFVAAKEESGLSPVAAERAEVLKAEFETLQNAVDDKNSELTERSRSFTQKRTSFQVSCGAYIK